MIPRFTGPLARNISNLSSEHLGVSEALSEESIDQLVELEADSKTEDNANNVDIPTETETCIPTNDVPSP